MERTGICKSGGGPSADPECAGAVTLDLPASRSVGNKFMVYATRALLFGYGSPHGQNQLGRRKAGVGGETIALRDASQTEMVQRLKFS